MISFYCPAVNARGSNGINIHGQMSSICSYAPKHFEREQNGLTAIFASKAIHYHEGTRRVSKSGTAGTL